MCIVDYCYDMDKCLGRLGSHVLSGGSGLLVLHVLANKTLFMSVCLVHKPGKLKAKQSRIFVCNICIGDTVCINKGRRL